MASLFRSEKMTYVQINVSNSAAHDTVRAIGRLGKLHLIDLAHLSGDQTLSKEAMAFKRQVLEYTQAEKQLEWFEEKMNEFKVDIPHVFPGVHHHRDVLDSVNHFLEPKKGELDQHLEFLKHTDRKIYSLKEHEHVLNVCRNELAARNDVRNDVDEEDALLNDIEEQVSDIELTRKGRSSPGANRFHKYICGIIPVLQQIAFSRMLFRVSRGNALVRFFNLQQPVTDPKTGESEFKSVFYIVVMGRAMDEKIRNLMNFFLATVYEVPERTDTIDQQLGQIRNELRENIMVHRKTKSEIVTLLRTIAYQPSDGTSPLRDWQVACRKEKSVYLSMTKAHHYLTYMVLEGWIPDENIQDLEEALHEAVVPSGLPAAAMLLQPDNPLSPIGSPPTYFKTDKVTSSYQDIVNTYGVPRYGEVNPGLFTIITFPFLFGIMYGDIGHGFALSIVSFYMVRNEKSLLIKHKHNKLGEVFSMVFEGRYLLLMMGLFAMYCGFIYNDCLSVPINLFGSKWKVVKDQPAQKIDSVYPFGVDPAWYGTKNELMFFNSLKMKISVIVGVIHMMFGIFLGYFNHKHFKDNLSLYFEFIPMVIFMSCTFGYMIIIIVYKFTVDWEKSKVQAPNLIQTMIQMFLQPGVVSPDVQLYPGQGQIQLMLLIVALLSVPVMIFGKPLLLRRRHLLQNSRHHGGAAYSSVNTLDSDDEKLPLTENEDSSKAVDHNAGGHGHGGEFNYTEIQIHQIIHTIEFVLGAVSNTASYLRLWALSLAHSELSQVFWEKLIIDFGVSSGNPIMIVISVGAWAGATSVVLLSMDVLECFLHALRLHWVEFQNKFFNADGYLFTPYSFDENTAVDLAS